ncbi:ribosome-associated protein [Halospina denitrificans]|uniref:Ribosome-associated protein n=1 Tax=Halospina denitrificans TaxID=332522 RepID=A0A4R7K1C1_9GAMM|nr:ribosome biogenesis factor YjgA [Halospina denitrificans]TDT43249.1 ribosome-associated protein [Halospina denitrificans]
MQSDQDHHEHDEGLPTKSQAKREMQALREMAAALGQLSSDRINSLPASAEFRDGLLGLKQLAEGEPRKRHIHYLGRRLLEEDEQALQRELDSQQSGTTENARRLHMAERWRERLLDEGKPALTAFIEAFPETDRQHLRQLVGKAAKQESSPNDRNSPKRRLYRYIREQIDEAERQRYR